MTCDMIAHVRGMNSIKVHTSHARNELVCILALWVCREDKGTEELVLFQCIDFKGVARPSASESR